MADIEKRISKLNRYFRGMQVEDIDGEQVIYVIVEFPPRWVVPDDVEAKFNVNVEKGQDAGLWYFIGELGIGFDALFDAVEYTVNVMMTAQERVNLLQSKVVELRNLFEDESMTIDMLRTLEFTWKGKKKIPKKIEKPITPEPKINVNENIIQEERLEDEEDGA